MAGGKRASMREGPLAALFRGTAEMEAEEKTGREEREERQAVERETSDRASRAWREAPPPEPDPVMESEEPRIPSPQERLRAAFSSDIPENVMAPPPAPREPDPYARGGAEPFGGSRPAAGERMSAGGGGGGGGRAAHPSVAGG